MKESQASTQASQPSGPDPDLRELLKGIQKTVNDIQTPVFKTGKRAMAESNQSPLAHTPSLKKAKTLGVGTGPASDDLQTAPPKPNSGSSSDPTEGQGETTKPMSTIVVSGIDPSVTSERLINYVKSKITDEFDPADFSAYAMIPRNKPRSELSFISFKFIFPTARYDALIAASFWPERTIIREYEDRPRQPNVFL